MMLLDVRPFQNVTFHPDFWKLLYISKVFHLYFPPFFGIIISEFCYNSLFIIGICFAFYWP